MRLIFCASPGRCGTKYLATMLDLLPKVVARHEPPPYFALADPTRPKTFWDTVKLPAIRHIVERTEAEVYIETDHAIMKGFYGAMFPTPDVQIDAILLSRPHREVALSLWRRNSIPGRTKHGKRHLVDPRGTLLGWQQLTDYQLCYWHCLEVERRSEEMADLVLSFDGVVHRTSLGRVTTRMGLRALIRALNLPEPNWGLLSRVGGNKINETPAGWIERVPGEDLDQAEREVRGLMGGYAR